MYDVNPRACVIKTETLSPILKYLNFEIHNYHEHRIKPIGVRCFFIGTCHFLNCNVIFKLYK